MKTPHCSSAYGHPKTEAIVELNRGKGTSGGRVFFPLLYDARWPVGLLVIEATYQISSKSVERLKKS